MAKMRASKLHPLLLALGAALAAAPAQAINLSQYGAGQVLLYPYYTVRNGFDTLLSVENLEFRTVAFRIRFREALNGRPVADWNVVLSPYDVWNGVVTSDGAGGALFRTYDTTCTSPRLPASATLPGATEVAFSNAAYASTAPLTADNPFRIDGGGTGIDRVQEGYFEIISMASSTQSYSSNAYSTNVVEYNAKHVAPGVPRNCAAVDAALASASTIAANFTGWSAPRNVLSGQSTFIDVTSGKAIDAAPTAIEDWVTQGGDWSVANNVFPVGNNQPTLDNGDLAATLKWLVDGTKGNATAPLTGGTGTPVDNVTALLMADYLTNQFVAAPPTTLTDWVVSFPTKHHYTDRVQVDGIAPFNQAFDWDTTDNSNNGEGGSFTPRGKSCDVAIDTIWNREGLTLLRQHQFAPFPEPIKLCHAANVIAYNGSNLFGTAVNHANWITTDVDTAGWIALQLLDSGNLTDAANTFTGLPAIGFAATVRNNSIEAGNNRNYGSGQGHAYRGGKNSGL